MPRICKIAILVPFLLVTILFLTRARMTEAQRVEAETRRAIDYMQLLNTQSVKKSPRLMLELLTLKKGTDPLMHFNDRFTDSLNRLLELGVVQKRAFQYFDSNGAPVNISLNAMFPSNEVLWLVQSHSNHLYEVTATPESIRRWEALARQYPGGAISRLP